MTSSSELKVIQYLKRNVLKSSNRRSETEKQWAKEHDKETHQRLRQISRKRTNRTCADCTATCPGWAVLPHGIHVCIHCAQIHRRIGRHISQVKAINTGTYLWHRDEIDCLIRMGNKRANALYLGGAGDTAPKKPHRDDPVHVHETYIRNKYEHLRWVDRSFTLKTIHDNDDEDDDDDVRGKISTPSSSVSKVRMKTKQRSRRTKRRAKKQASRKEEVDVNLIDWTSDVDLTTTTSTTTTTHTIQENSMPRSNIKVPSKTDSIMALYETKRSPSKTTGPAGTDFFAQYGV